MVAERKKQQGIEEKIMIWHDGLFAYYLKWILTPTINTYMHIHIHIHMRSKHACFRIITTNTCNKYTWHTITYLTYVYMYVSMCMYKKVCVCRMKPLECYPQHEDFTRDTPVAFIFCISVNSSAIVGWIPTVSVKSYH